MKEKREQYKRARFFDQRGKISHKKLLAVMVALVMIVSAAVVINTARLKTLIDKTTKNYVSDVSAQIGEDINFRLETVTKDLELLRESLMQADGLEEREQVRAFLKKRADILGFSSLAIVDASGSGYYTDQVNRNIRGTGGFEASMEGEDAVSFMGEQSLLYTIPFHTEYESAAVLAGIRDKANMQQLLDTESFNSRGLSCIVDRQGKVLVSPTDAKPFLILEDLFDEKKDSGLVQDIEQMLRDMKVGHSGVLSFTAVDGKKLLMAYSALDSQDWILFTLIPEDLISSETDRYIAQTIAIIAGIFIVFFLALMIMFYIYKSHQTQLEQIAFVDPVTGGMNNADFRLRCEKLLQGSKPGTYCIVSFNIKNFKLINEYFGVKAGDKILHHVMRKLESNLREGELAARGESDHYFLCLKENRPDEIQKRLTKMVNDINSFNDQREEPYYLVFHQGAYLVDEPSLEITIIQDRANTAARSRSGYDEGSCVFYDMEITKKLQRERQLNDLFEQSLKNREFQLYLQPKVLLKDQTAGGAEALVRWIHPQLGFISPGDFIPIFERNDNICKLDLYMFEEVCRLIDSWRKQDIPPVTVSVNLSRRHFRNGGFLKQFEQIFDQYKIPRGAMELELTESIFFDDHGIEAMKKAIKEMHRIGLSCSLDDFGAGYSSLGLLKEFDVDAIKLDRQFFLGAENQRAKDVVESIVELSKKLKIHTVAEGIEEKEQLDFLYNIGCDMVQGYIFSKPLPVKDFENWLRNNLNKK